MRFWFNRFALAGLITGFLIFFGIHKPLGAGAAGFAVALGVIGSIYLGTLIVKKQSLTVILQEVLAAIMTITFAVMGLLFHPLWLVPGYMFHGLWDWAHHKDRYGARVSSWYPPFCAVVDIVIGICIFVVFGLA